MSEDKQVKFSELANFTDKQRKAKDMIGQFKFLLYGGAMGGGKSYWLRWALLLQLLKWAKQGHIGVRVGLFCEDYPALKDRHLSKVQFEFPEWLGKLNKSDNEYVLNPEFGSGVICFRNLDDVSKYQSAEFAMVAVDELTKNEQEVFTFLRTRLRWTGIEDCKFIAGTNPGDIGHGWVRKLFIDKDFDDNEKEGSLFGFIQALADDNPYLSKSYVKSLDSLPEEYRKAFRYGDWDVFKGQFFTNWRKQKDGKPYHVIPSYQIDKNLDEFYGDCDWGFEPDAFCYHLSAVRKISLPGASFLRITTFAELYGRKKYPYQWAAEIKKLETDLGIEVKERWIDPSACNRHPVATYKEGSGTSVIEQFEEAGITFLAANNDKKNGFQAMRNWLAEAKDGMPFFQVSEACSNLIRQFPAAIFDENNPFLVKEGSEDHALMSTRYFLISRPNNSIEPKKVIVEYSQEYFKALGEEGKPRQTWL